MTPGILGRRGVIRSEAQRRLFAAELARRKQGLEPRALLGMSMEEIEYDLKRSKGKNLPERKNKVK